MNSNFLWARAKILELGPNLQIQIPWVRFVSAKKCLGNKCCVSSFWRSPDTWYLCIKITPVNFRSFNAKVSCDASNRGRRPLPGPPALFHRLSKPWKNFLNFLFKLVTFGHSWLEIAHHERQKPFHFLHTSDSKQILIYFSNTEEVIFFLQVRPWLGHLAAVAAQGRDHPGPGVLLQHRIHRHQTRPEDTQVPTLILNELIKVSEWRLEVFNSPRQILT